MGAVVVLGRKRTHPHFAFYGARPFYLIFGFAAALIFVRQQESRGGSVCFGDDPNSHVVSDSISTEDSKTVSNRKFIFVFVFFTQLAPISSLMPFEKLRGILISLFQSS